MEGETKKIGDAKMNSRLRTETAGVVACHTVSVINEL